MELNFDEMVVDIKLAKEHLEKEKELSKLYKDYKKLCCYVYDGTFNQKPKDKLVFTEINADQRSQLNKKLHILAVNTIANWKLIAELEYLSRKIPIEDTRIQLNIVTDYLTCYTPALQLEEISNLYEVDIPIYSEDPVLIYGNIKRLLCCKSITFTATRLTAYVAHLFVKLCHRSGLDNVRLQFTDDGSLPLRTQIDWNCGTVAVVSEDADIDSAVDKFIAVSKLAPWRLRRILVQESVYQQFKDALTWKCNLKQKRDDWLDPLILCSATLVYDGKIFIIDPVELLTGHSVVYIEAYRTRKEMISMVQKDATHYLSLWSNGIAEINEVTHKTKAPIAWVNNLAEFEGPLQVSQAVYTHMFDELKLKCCENISGLRDSLKHWQECNFEYRRNILKKLIDKSGRFVSMEVADNIRDSLADCSMKSFVDAGDKYVWVGMSSPVGIILVSRDTVFTQRTFKSLLYGNAILALGNLDVQDLFEADRLPIACITQINVDKSGVPVHSVLDCSFRAVWTNSGTIFAN